MAPAEGFEAIRGRVAKAARILVLGGAGMSAESGVPTFRGARDGLWARFDPGALATPEAWAADPALVWAWYLWRMALVRRACPHAGHRALAEAARLRPLELVTQNVDDLHERAGSTGVVHLHGELFAHRCADCARPHAEVAIPAPGAVPQRLEPPRCAHCGGRVRPGVVWFGEPLPEAAFDAARRMAAACDLMLVVGTSGLVQPAAGLPLLARRAGACLVEVNPEPGGLSPHMDFSLRMTAAEALPALLGGTRDARASGRPRLAFPGVAP